MDDPAARTAFSPAEPAQTLAFSGSGAEYFRIWIVNLLLTVATLGIYSAWAKTRRLQYFYRNTRLAGASFDFRGDPKAILRGRILAVTVLALYHYAFGFSLKFGVVTAALLLAGLPIMMRAALRFRLSNSYYRGLPFGFSGSVKEAYLVYLLPVAMFVLPGVLVALMPNNPLSGSVFLLYLCWPLMHGAMKAYQHKHLMAGDQPASFALGTTDLAKPYVRAFLLGLGLMILVGVGIAALTSLVVSHFSGRENHIDGMLAAVLAVVATAILPYLAVIVGVLLAYLFVLLSGPYIMVRMNNLAWSATSFPGVRITCAMKPGAYLRLQTVNVLLILLTLGLFRPFAAVRTWRYRVAHVRVEAPDGFEQAVLAARRPPVAAAGDGVADFLGVDLSW